MKVLDTFAGAGGFSLGFEQAGFEVVGAIESDSWATDTFKFNHPDSVVIKGSIEEISNKELKKAFKGIEPDVVLGGPPCQGFSVCTRKNNDPKDPRNSLFEEFLRVGKVFDPSVMIMENVPNLIKARTSTGELVLEIIESELRKIGYHVYSTILEAVHYGVPQIRKRLVIVASKIALVTPFPEPTHALLGAEIDLFGNSLDRTPNVWDAISDLPTINAREGAEVMEYKDDAKTDYQRLMRVGARPKLYNHLAMKHGKRMVERFASMKWGDTINDVPAHLKPIKRNSNGAIATSGYDQSNRRMHPDKPCHTIPASFYANFVHPYLHRNFTAREGARLQSFPDHYVFLGKPTVVSHKLLEREGRFEEKYLCQYNQVGNAVPPLLAKAIAKNIQDQL